MTPGDGVGGSLFDPLGTGLEVHFFDPLGTGLVVHFLALCAKK